MSSPVSSAACVRQRYSRLLKLSYTSLDKRYRESKRGKPWAFSSGSPTAFAYLACWPDDSSKGSRKIYVIKYCVASRRVYTPFTSARAEGSLLEVLADNRLEIRSLLNMFPNALDESLEVVHSCSRTQISVGKEGEEGKGEWGTHRARFRALEGRRRDGRSARMVSRGGCGCEVGGER